MAGIIGVASNGLNRFDAEINPKLSSDLSALDPDAFDPLPYARSLLSHAIKNGDLIQSANNYAIEASGIGGAYFYDFYYRIHVTPKVIDLQTIASPQTRQVKVWNGYPNLSAALDDIVISNGQGIVVNGPLPPQSMAPLQEFIYDITVGTSGPAAVNAEILFDFSNVFDPLPLIITGTRAVKFGIIPEVPVKEDWEWLTDVIVAVDGTEQRISLRGEVPRYVQSFKAVFENGKEVNAFYNKLVSSFGRLWIAEYQYATTLTAASLAGTNVLTYDNTATDIRVGEYVLIVSGANDALVEIESLTPTGATLSAPLTFNVAQNDLIIPGSPAFLNNETSLERYSVNTVAQVNLNCRMVRQRSTLTRTGSAVVLPTFLGDPVCIERPLADELVVDAVDTGQENIDNETGLLDIVSQWNYSRVIGERQFKVHRVRAPAEMDYWKTMLAYARGQARKFWMPTYREDLTIATTPGDNAAAIEVEGVDYAQKTFALITHRYLEIETASGIHRATVTNATASINSNLAIVPSLPSGVGWTQIKRISHLLPVRLGSDRASWQHFGLDSILTLTIRTAEP